MLKGFGEARDWVSSIGEVGRRRIWFVYLELPDNETSEKYKDSRLVSVILVADVRLSVLSAPIRTVED